MQATRILTNNREQHIPLPLTNSNNNKRTIINKPSRAITSKQQGMDNNPAIRSILDDIKLHV